MALPADCKGLTRGQDHSNSLPGKLEYNHTEDGRTMHAIFRRMSCDPDLMGYVLWSACQQESAGVHRISNKLAGTYLLPQEDHAALLRYLRATTCPPAEHTAGNGKTTDNNGNARPSAAHEPWWLTDFEFTARLPAIQAHGNRLLTEETSDLNTRAASHEEEIRNAHEIVQACLVTTRNVEKLQAAYESAMQVMEKVQQVNEKKDQTFASTVHDLEEIIKLLEKRLEARDKAAQETATISSDFARPSRIGLGSGSSTEAGKVPRLRRATAASRDLHKTVSRTKRKTSTTDTACARVHKRPRSSGKAERISRYYAAFR